MLTPEERQIVQAARDLIADPERWCQHALAVREDGTPTVVSDPKACRYCAWGALIKAMKVPDKPIERNGYMACYETAAKLMPEVEENGIGVLVDLNDHDGHSAVLALFDQALAREAA